MTPVSYSHLFDVSVEAENKIAGIHNDTADDAHFHHLLPQSNYIIGEVAHHVEENSHLHAEFQRAVD